MGRKGTPGTAGLRPPAWPWPQPLAHHLRYRPLPATFATVSCPPPSQPPLAHDRRNRPSLSRPTACDRLCGVCGGICLPLAWGKKGSAAKTEVECHERLLAKLSPLDWPQAGDLTGCLRRGYLAKAGKDWSALLDSTESITQRIRITTAFRAPRPHGRQPAVALNPANKAPPSS